MSPIGLPLSLGTLASTEGIEVELPIRVGRLNEAIRETVTLSFSDSQQAAR
jgi:hypothetical protein